MGSLDSWACRPPLRHVGVKPGGGALRRLPSVASATLLTSAFMAVAWAGPLAGPAAAASIPAGYVVAWGDDSLGQTSLPASANYSVTAISAGVNHALALKSNQTVIAWGDDNRGQTDVPAGLSGVVAIAAGNEFSLALKSDGTIAAWGDDSEHEIDVPALPAGYRYKAIAAGDSYGLALEASGSSSNYTIVSWGNNTYGQRNTPVTCIVLPPKVCLPLMGVKAISAGHAFATAIRSNNTVAAWGASALGQTTVPAGLSDVIAISSGLNHTLALKSNGTVVAWGYNAKGQINVPAGLSNVVQVSAGSGIPDLAYSLALKHDGTIVGWGDNSKGQLNISPAATGVSRISAGGNFGLALIYQSIAGAPTGLIGIDLYDSVGVSWTAPAYDGHSPIITYTVTASPGGKTCTTASLNCTVTGLTAGTPYTFTVTANNIFGAGHPSTALGPITPLAPATPKPTATPTATPKPTATPSKTTAASVAPSSPTPTPSAAATTSAAAATHTPTPNSSTPAAGATPAQNASGGTTTGSSGDNTPLILALVVVGVIAVLLAGALAWALLRARARNATPGSSGTPPPVS
jgi:cell division septation protein DedD